MKSFETFKEISVGGLSQEQLMQRLVSAGIQFNKYADVLFGHAAFVPSAQAQTVRLVKASLADFGFSNPCSYQEFVGRALASGLRLCPLYLGAFLRLSVLDQPEGPYLTIASALPERDENFPKGFYIRNHENSLWLRGYVADDFCEWPQDNEFIFLK